jgi:hypothetical protein
MGAGAGAGAATGGAAGGRDTAGIAGAAIVPEGRSPAGIAGRCAGAPAATDGRGAVPLAEIGKTAAQTWQRARTPAAGILAGSTR